MKLSLTWAQYYSNVDLAKIGHEKLLDKIGSQLGAVDEVTEWGKRLEGVRVVKIVSCEKHPNADKLSLCLIDDGGAQKGIKRTKDGLVEVVCGAPNARAGIYTAWVTPGTTLPETYDSEPLVIEKRAIRGVVSNGMLASLKELGIGRDHSGIAELDLAELAKGTKIGDSVAKALWAENDLIIDIENKMFTHRPDCFGILGLARELAGIQQLSFTSPEWYLEGSKLPKPKQKLPLKVHNDVLKLAQRFSAVVISGLEIKPSPVHIQADLARVGVRPINNIVDLTNYYMMLTGQPLHAFDYHKIKEKSGATPTLGVRLARDKEQLTLLGNKKITLTKEDLVLTTDKHAVDLAGIMGGAETEVDEKTTAIILTCCNFDMYSVRRSAMRHGIFNDAATRNMKEQSPLQNTIVLTKTAEDILEHGGGSTASEVFDLTGKLPKPSPIKITADFINERLGFQLKASEMQKLLRNVEFTVKVEGETLHVRTPFWRTDISIPEDIVEEIGRLYGYDQLPIELPQRDLKAAKLDELAAFKHQLREALNRAGANEVLSYSFVHGDLMRKAGQDPTHAYQIANALSPDLQYYRTGLTPSLLDKVHMNIRAGFDQFALFEIGKVHYKGEMDESEPEVPNEDNHIALVIASEDKHKPIGAPYYHARKYFEQIAGELGSDLVLLADFDLKTDEWGRQLTAPYEPKSSAVVVREGQIWGVVGEHRASVRQAFKLPAYSAGFEINLGVLKPEEATYQPLPKFPKVSQDITLQVPATELFANVEKQLSLAISKVAAKLGKNVWSIEPLDIYQSQPDSPHKHLTWRLTIASYEGTLRAEEVNALLDAAAAQLKQEIEAKRI